MRTLACLAVAIGALLSSAAYAADALTSLHPEEAIPDRKDPVSSWEFSGYISRVQKKLHALGFDAGPANGDFGEKTQAALAQFQLSRNLPVSGTLDEATVAELGVRREEPHPAAGATHPRQEAAGAR